MLRDYSIDLLRITAAIFVVLLHTSATYISLFPVDSTQWNFVNIYDSLTRWSVPVFVMISGAFLLQKEMSIKFLYGKYIKRLFILLICWNVLYNIYTLETFPSGIIEFMSMAISISGGYHLWYLYMLIGLYILIPVLKKVVDGGLSKYIIILWLISGVLLEGFSDKTLYQNRFNHLMTNVYRFPFVVKYVGYFVLGHYLYKEVSLSHRNRKMIYLLGVGGGDIYYSRNFYSF